MSDCPNKFNLKRIAGTLKYGGFDGSKRKLILISYIAFVSVFVIMGVCMILYMTGVIGDGKTDVNVNILEIIVGSLFMFVLLPLGVGILIFKNEKQRNEIKLWLEDAVELKAYSRKIDAFSTLLSQEQYKIQIEFEYGGKSFCCVSRGKIFKNSEEARDGYHAEWRDYLDKEVSILYSPKYEEVMVLKNNVGISKRME